MPLTWHLNLRFAQSKLSAAHAALSEVNSNLSRRKIFGTHVPFIRLSWIIVWEAFRFPRKQWLNFLWMACVPHTATAVAIPVAGLAAVWLIHASRSAR